MPERVVCIYHDDNDGFGAAWCVQRRMPRAQVAFVAAQYGDSPPDVSGADVMIVDFSYRRETMIKLIADAASVTVYDHHKTAQAELDGLDKAANTKVVFDMSKSGVLITWEQLFPDEEPPELIHYLDAADLWQLGRLPAVREVRAALGAYHHDFAVWDRFMTPEGLAQLKTEGGPIMTWIQAKVMQLVDQCRLMVLGDYEVMVVNCPSFFASDVAGYLAENYPPFGVTYYDSSGCRNFSLRSRSSFDVSDIARKFGGGGHPQAAGFKVPLI